MPVTVPPMDTIGDRIKKAKGEDTYAAVAQKLALEGVVITPQGVHKWTKGGEVPEASLVVFCRVYDVSPAYIRYGIDSSAVAAALDVNVLRAALDMLSGIEKSRRRDDDAVLTTERRAVLLAAAYQGLINPGAKAAEVEKIIKLVA